MKIKTKLQTLLISFLLFGANHVLANEVEIIDVKASQVSDNSWTFAVTLKHDDEGWDHYANEWQVIAPDNKILATRTLYHPHVKEQPFTRNIKGVKISDSIKSVRVIARDTVHGLSKNVVEIELASNALTKITLDLKKAK